MKLFILGSFLISSVALGAGKEIKPVGKKKAPAANAKAKAIAPTLLDLLKGEWTDCRPDPSFVGDVLKKEDAPMLRDLYTQVSPNSFTQTIGKSKGEGCKKVSSKVTTTFDCEVFSPELLTCKPWKTESEHKSGKSMSMTDRTSERYQSQNSFKLAIVQKAPDTLVLTFTSDGNEESETFELKKAMK